LVAVKLDSQIVVPPIELPIDFVAPFFQLSFCLLDLKKVSSFEAVAVPNSKLEAQNYA
jgi:hypothetical protein